MATVLERVFDLYFVHLNVSDETDKAANINCAVRAGSEPCGEINFYRGTVPPPEAASMFGPWTDPTAVYITLSLPFDLLQPTLQMLALGKKWNIWIATDEPLAGNSKVVGTHGSVGMS
jgi:hypothetical protein